MREHFRSFDSKISFFAFADIITAVSGMLIFITLLLATDLGRPTDNRSQAAKALEQQLKETLAREAAADAENQNLQQLLATANTAPDADKLETDITRLRAELADEQSKHAGLIEQLAASKTALEQQDKLLGITAVQEQLQQSGLDLESLGNQEVKIHQDTAALEKKILITQAKTAKLRQRVGQLWLIPEQSTTAKEPVLVTVSSKGASIERFNHPEMKKQFKKSDTHSEFEDYLKTLKPEKQYVLFLIRPSGIAVFKDLVQVARKQGYEVGFDALEENREIHFNTPPPVQIDEPVVERQSEENRAAAPKPAATLARNYPTGSITNTATTEYTNTASTVFTNATATTHTNLPSAGEPPPQPPPPPKPKSWWERLLEWIGLGK